ncbi:MAG: L-lactate dehydrogenase, partial [Ruminococcus sp.]|nr:L-lactate dehydrogenase [Ruminococcus sp.]
VPQFDFAAVEEYVRKSGASVIERKGATFYAVATSVCYICKCLLTGIDTTMTVSTMLHGEYGLDDICLSILNIVGNKGVQGKVMLPLTDTEIKQLHYSADCVRNVINSIEF